MAILLKFHKNSKFNKFQSGGSVPVYSSFRVTPSRVSSNLKPYDVLLKYEALKNQKQRAAGRSKRQSTPKPPTTKIEGVDGLDNDLQAFYTEKNQLEAAIRAEYINDPYGTGTKMLGLLNQHDKLSELVVVMKNRKADHEAIEEKIKSKEITGDSYVFSTSDDGDAGMGRVMAYEIDSQGNRTIDYVDLLDLNEKHQIDGQKETSLKYIPITIEKALQLEQRDSSFVNEHKFLDDMSFTIGREKADLETLDYFNKIKGQFEESEKLVKNTTGGYELSGVNEKKQSCRFK
jgi:hypothetical protein